MNLATQSAHHYDASRDDKCGESQRWAPTLETDYAHAYYAPRAEPRRTAPRQHGRDAPERSAR